MARIRSSTLNKRHRAFGTAAEDWASTTAYPSLRRYAFRNGVSHLLAVREPDRAAELVTDFSGLMARLSSENGAGATPLLDDARAVARSADLSNPVRMAIWLEFLRGRVHILARGDGGWGAEKILLQLVMEHAETSPITRAAHHWIEAGNGDWPWLMKRTIPPTPETVIQRVLEGHQDVITKVRWLNGTLVSGDRSGGLRVWNLQQGTSLELAGHKGGVRHIAGNTHDLLASWGTDGRVCVWDREGKLQQEWAIPWVDELFFVGRNRLVWVEQGRVTIRDVDSDALVAVHENARAWPLGPSAMAIAQGNEVRVVRPDSEAIIEAAFEVEYLAGTVDRLVVGNRHHWQIFHRGTDGWGLVRDFETAPGAEVLLMTGGRLLFREPSSAEYEVRSLLDGSQIVSGTFQQLPILFLDEWDEERLVVYCPYQGGVHLVSLKDQSIEFLQRFPNAVPLNDGMAVSWVERQLLVWNSGDCVVEEQHSGAVSGAMELDDGRVLTWSKDGQVRVWDPVSGECVGRLHTPGLQIAGCVCVLGRVLISWRLFMPWTFSFWDLKDGRELGSIQAPHRPGREPIVTVKDGAADHFTAGPVRIRWNKDGMEVFKRTDEGEASAGHAPFDPKSVERLGSVVQEQRSSADKARAIQRTLRWHTHHPVTPWLFTKSGIVMASLPDGRVEFLDCMRGRDRFVPRFKSKKG